MKTIKNRVCLSLILLGLGIGQKLTAQIGCMDNSYHGCLADGPDYKTLHYVSCSCPCDRYRKSNRRGTCEQCLHYRMWDYNPARDRF